MKIIDNYEHPGFIQNQDSYAYRDQSPYQTNQINQSNRILTSTQKN
jgi:hypothetical protein